MTDYILPSTMKQELLAATHAGQAESVFRKYESVCFVEHQDRARIYSTIETLTGKG